MSKQAELMKVVISWTPDRPRAFRFDGLRRRTFKTWTHQIRTPRRKNTLRLGFWLVRGIGDGGTGSVAFSPRAQKVGEDSSDYAMSAHLHRDVASHIVTTMFYFHLQEQ